MNRPQYSKGKRDSHKRSEVLRQAASGQKKVAQEGSFSIRRPLLSFDAVRFMLNQFDKKELAITPVSLRPDRRPFLDLITIREGGKLVKKSGILPADFVKKIHDTVPRVFNTQLDLRPEGIRVFGPREQPYLGFYFQDQALRDERSDLEFELLQIANVNIDWDLTALQMPFARSVNLDRAYVAKAAIESAMPNLVVVYDRAQEFTRDI